MKNTRLLAILMTLTLLCAAAFAPQAALAEVNPRFTGSWYANSFVLEGLEYFPETWDEDLVMTLGADGHFTWSGKFYNDFFGSWKASGDAGIKLIIDNDDGTPGSEEEDSVTLELNQDGYLVYIEENGPTILFADHMPEKPVRPEIIRAENVYKFSGAWVLERILVADMYMTMDQYAVVSEIKCFSSLVLDNLDAYLDFSTNLGNELTVQLKMKYDNGSLVQVSGNTGVYLKRVSMTDLGILVVEFCPDASGTDPLILYYSKAE